MTFLSQAVRYIYVDKQCYGLDYTLPVSSFLLFAYLFSFAEFFLL